MVAHAVVNGLGVAALASMHLWGQLGAELAAGAVLVVCGVWAHTTRHGPPGGPPGLAGIVAVCGEALSRLRS